MNFRKYFVIYIFLIGKYSNFPIKKKGQKEGKNPGKMRVSRGKGENQ